MNNKINYIIDKSLDDQKLSANEIADLFNIALFSKESALIIAAGRVKSEKASNGFAEVHAQVGLNIAPCQMNCMFCAFAAKNKVFESNIELTVEEVIESTRQFEDDGANAIFTMCTANYEFEKFIEISAEIRQSLRKETILVANVGDLTIEQAKALKNTGFSGVYHAIRLGEGKDTNLKIKDRYDTFRNVKEAGLNLGTCVEPVGNEHSIEELVEKTIITREAQPVYSGSARRIPIPGTEMAKHGITSEARMAHILAAIRLALPLSIPGNCTHEPNTIGAAAGANLLWAESGSNPRDIVKDTEEKRGMTVAECKNILEEAEWKVLQGSSNFYTKEQKA